MTGYWLYILDYSNHEIETGFNQALLLALGVQEFS